MSADSQSIQIPLRAQSCLLWLSRFRLTLVVRMPWLVCAMFTISPMGFAASTTLLRLDCKVLISSFIRSMSSAKISECSSYLHWSLPLILFFPHPLPVRDMWRRSEGSLMTETGFPCFAPFFLARGILLVLVLYSCRCTCGVITCFAVFVWLCYLTQKSSMLSRSFHVLSCQRPYWSLWISFIYLVLFSPRFFSHASQYQYLLYSASIRSPTCLFFSQEWSHAGL